MRETSWRAQSARAAQQMHTHVRNVSFALQTICGPPETTRGNPPHKHAKMWLARAVAVASLAAAALPPAGHAHRGPVNENSGGTRVHGVRNTGRDHQRPVTNLSHLLARLSPGAPGERERERESFIMGTNVHNGVVSGAARGQALLGPMWAGLTPDSKGDPTGDTEEPEPRLSGSFAACVHRGRTPRRPMCVWKSQGSQRSTRAVQTACAEAPRAACLHRAPSTHHPRRGSTCGATTPISQGLSSSHVCMGTS